MRLCFARFGSIEPGVYKRWWRHQQSRIAKPSGLYRGRIYAPFLWTNFQPTCWCLRNYGWYCPKVLLWLWKYRFTTQLLYDLTRKFMYLDEVIMLTSPKSLISRYSQSPVDSHHTYDSSNLTELFLRQVPLRYNCFCHQNPGRYTIQAVHPSPLLWPHPNLSWETQAPGCGRPLCLAVSCPRVPCPGVLPVLQCRDRVVHVPSWDKYISDNPETLGVHWIVHTSYQYKPYYPWKSWPWICPNWCRLVRLWSIFPGQRCENLGIPRHRCLSGSLTDWLGSKKC